MSLSKETCKLCWLPPDDSGLCRKCKGREEPSLLWKIRFHRDSFCKTFRDLLRTGDYKGVAFPEECVQCCQYLLPQEKWKELILLWWRVQSYTTLVSIIGIWFLKNREDALDYCASVMELLAATLEDPAPVSKKIVSALVAVAVKRVGPSGRAWILQELAQRPSAFGAFMQIPIVLPAYLTENFWEYIEDHDEWWALWEKTKKDVDRKIRFRCLAYKEELLAYAWAPERMHMCIDIDERISIGSFLRRS